MTIQRYLLPFLAAAMLAAAQPKNSDAALGAARHLEDAEGNYPAAIEAYKKFLTQYGKDRALAAKALVRMGQCYEKLCDAESGKIYERVVREFADQASAVTEARERLAKLNPANAAKSAVLTARQIWTGQDTGGSLPKGIAPTANGKSLLFVDPQSGDAATRDIATGEIRRIGFKKSGAESPGHVEFALYSPDQRQIVYCWYAPNENPRRGYRLRLGSMEPGAKPRDLISDPESYYIWPDAWSPDGKSILIRIWKDNRTIQIAWVSAADGSLKIVKSFDRSIPKGVSLSPDGRYIAYDRLERMDSTDRDIFILTADGTSDVAAVQSPGDDKSPTWTPDGKHLVFTSNRSRNTGLYGISVRDGKAVGPAGLLKAEIGQVGLAVGITNGEVQELIDVAGAIERDAQDVASQHS